MDDMNNVIPMIQQKLDGEQVDVIIAVNQLQHQFHVRTEEYMELNQIQLLQIPHDFVNNE